MSDIIITFPGPSLRMALARVAENAVQRDAFAASPRGRFLAACSGLAAAGYEHTADRAIDAYRGDRSGRGFQREDRFPDPASMGDAFALLASIPPGDEPAMRHVRVGLTALVAIATPFNDEPGSAA